MAMDARRPRRALDIWPGFVDALATLLLVIIFVLMVFVLSQFYLTQALSGRDEALERLHRQVAELTDMLSMERRANTDLRLTVAQLSTELQRSTDDRDQLTAQMGLLRDERQALQDTLAVARERVSGLEASLSTGVDRMAYLEQQADAVSAELASAYRQIDADRESISLQLREIESLRRDLAALQSARDALEQQIAELAATLRLAEAELESERERGLALEGDLAGREAALAELQASLAATRAELSERDSELAESLSALTAARDRSMALEARLSTEEERTALAQREIEARDIRLEELEAEQVRLSEEAGRLAAALGEAEAASDEDQAELERLRREVAGLQQLRDALRVEVQELADRLDARGGGLAVAERMSAEQAAQIALLNAQLAQVREQLAQVLAALGEAEARMEDQEATIADLGTRLNLALASTVEELARFRSEFFGRLRQVLGDRDDIRIVGDRFVFQSEVLFGVASDELGGGGQAQLANLATALREIADRIPPEIDWILQVDGHTDNRPIRTPQFPSNWELSTARAISVVKHLIDQGIPAHRLAATGYGEFQPIDDREVEEAFARNRRIELKLTQR